ncbi:Patatin-like phospholipase domain-containing protein 7 [Bulinus truncatus]|nr:Patatin-like phospholipase domain-containing protein 7 [Bulinus truncatus]
MNSDFQLWPQWDSELTISIVVSIIVAAITIFTALFFGIWKYKSKVLPSQAEAPKRYRFRKRDKVMFFGRKMLRKVKSFTRNTVGGPSGGMRRKPSHKQMIARIRRFLAHRKDPSKPRLKQQSPPQSFLEADWSDINEDHRLPPEVLYMLRSIRVFGHLEKPFFLELCRYMETITLRAGHVLFKIGDPDDSIYVVQNGVLEVYITDVDGTEHLIKQVATGNSIHSLLSILDVLTGHPGSFKSVSARALTDSTILRLPAHAFKSMFEKFNQSAVKVVQIIMIRLQRVTFSALHNYLGLSKELLKSDVHIDVKDLNIHRLNRTGTGSPSMGSPIRHPPSSNTEAVKDEADGAAAGVTIGTPLRKSLISRPLSESGSQLSDFDAALMRARASVSDDKSIVLSGSPPRKVTFTHTGIGESSPSSSYRSRSIPDEEIILSLAMKDLVHILGLKDPSLLDGRVTLSDVCSGSVFCRQGDQDTRLFFLVRGTVSVLQNVIGETGKEVLMFHAEPGEIIDVLSVLTGEPSFFTMRAKTDAIMAVITKPDFYQVMRVEPFIVLNLAHCTVKRMSPFVRQIDFALDWQMLEAGKALFRQGDSSDSIFIVLTGRLRSVITLVGGKKELVNEFGRGELVGIVEVLTQHERATTVLAIRDTELAKIPSELLNLIKLRYPQVVARLIHLLGTSILGNWQQKNTMTLQTSISRESDAYSKMERTTVANLSTIAIVPVTEDVPTTNFALELQHALLTIGPTVRLTPDIVKARLGEAALDSVNEFSLFNWLSQQEDIHRMCLYQCDYQLTKWSKHCLKQADCILFVGLAHKDPTIGPIEKELESIAVRAQKELILLHKEDTETPKNTAEWLNARGWLSSHHHIRCPKRVLRSKSPAKTLELYEHLFKTEPDRMADFSRLARFLTGTSIGLVLGGGGARGLAHVGMIKAMQEEGIPVDMVGGTSMGAFIGALWAEERNYVRFTQRAREWSIGMTSLWRKIWDLTYPVTSMFTGWAFNESIENVFHDRQIEDLWIPYFCITTNISNSSMRVHSLGSVWRYVRASMSLSGYLPPLCDPLDGHLLLDGGYVNNLPADVMHNLGAKFVFAIDVGSQDEKDLTNYGDCLSGWWLLWKRWNPWAKPVRVPDMTEIQSRLAYVSCVRQLEVVKNSDYCEYIRPPIDRYATLQFGSFDEIVDTGYHHGKTLFSAWSKGTLHDKLFKESESLSKQSKAHKERNPVISHVPVMAYFTDLAEQVSKIENPKSKFYLSADSEEEVIDEEDEDPAHMMEGYEEDDEFAHSDGDEEMSEDGEELVSKSKVTSVISHKLSMLKKPFINLAQTSSDISHYQSSHQKMSRVVRNSMDSVNYRMKVPKLSVHLPWTSKPSLTQEQIDALASDESSLGILFSSWPAVHLEAAEKDDRCNQSDEGLSGQLRTLTDELKNTVRMTSECSNKIIFVNNRLPSDNEKLRSCTNCNIAIETKEPKKTLSCSHIFNCSHYLGLSDLTVRPTQSVDSDLTVRPTQSVDSVVSTSQQFILRTDCVAQPDLTVRPTQSVDSVVSTSQQFIPNTDCVPQSDLTVRPTQSVYSVVSTSQQFIPNTDCVAQPDLTVRPTRSVDSVVSTSQQFILNTDCVPQQYVSDSFIFDASDKLANGSQSTITESCLFPNKDFCRTEFPLLQILEDKDICLDKSSHVKSIHLSSDEFPLLEKSDVGKVENCLHDSNIYLDKSYHVKSVLLNSDEFHLVQTTDEAHSKHIANFSNDEISLTQTRNVFESDDICLPYTKNLCESEEMCLQQSEDLFGCSETYLPQARDLLDSESFLLDSENMYSDESHSQQTSHVNTFDSCLFLSTDNIGNDTQLKEKSVGTLNEIQTKNCEAEVLSSNETHILQANHFDTDESCLQKSIQFSIENLHSQHTESFQSAQFSTEHLHSQHPECLVESHRQVTCDSYLSSPVSDDRESLVVQETHLSSVVQMDMSVSLLYVQQVITSDSRGAVNQRHIPTELKSETSIGYDNFESQLAFSVCCNHQVPEIIIDNYDDKVHDLSHPEEQHKVCHLFACTCPDCVNSSSHLLSFSTENCHEQMDKRDTFSFPTDCLSVGKLYEGEESEAKDDHSHSSVSSYHTCEHSLNEEKCVNKCISADLCCCDLSLPPKPRSKKTSQKLNKKYSSQVSSPRNSVLERRSALNELSQELSQSQSGNKKNSSSFESKVSEKYNKPRVQLAKIESLKEKTQKRVANKPSSLPTSLGCKNVKSKKKSRKKTNKSSSYLKAQSSKSVTSSCLSPLSNFILYNSDMDSSKQDLQRIYIKGQNQESQCGATIGCKKLSNFLSRNHCQYLLNASPPCSQPNSHTAQSGQGKKLKAKSAEACYCKNPRLTKSLSTNWTLSATPSFLSTFTESTDLNVGLMSSNSRCWSEVILLTDYLKNTGHSSPDSVFLKKQLKANLVKPNSKSKEKQQKIRNFLKRMERLECKLKKKVGKQSKNYKSKSEHHLPIVDHFKKIFDTKSRQDLTQPVLPKKTSDISNRSACLVCSSASLLNRSPIFGAILDRNWMGSRRYPIKDLGDSTLNFTWKNFLDSHRRENPKLTDKKY